MKENPYPVLGTRQPVMRGRRQLFEKLCRHLTKDTPDHLSVVGPRHIGKTVLLRHLTEQFRSLNQHYAAVLYWDLRHSTPDSDAAFKTCFAEEIKKTLASVENPLSAELDEVGDDAGGILEAVFEILEDDNQRVLCVLDGFDRVLASGAITRNLWDYMRTLAHRRSLRLVIGSQDRLRELCKTPESQTSDFWEIFYDTPLQVGPFNELDWQCILEPFDERHITFDPSAKKEMVNWSGGIPILVAGLLSRLYETALDGDRISKAHIDTTAMEAFDECRDQLGNLWDDCTVEMQTDLVALSNDPLPASELPNDRQRSLKERGFIALSGSHIKSACRMMERYALAQSGGVQDMRRLFGDPARFDTNIRNLLELRIAQVPRLDPQLLNYVERAIRDLHPVPADAIVWMRSITTRALELIWEKELSDGHSIPAEWLEEWKYAGAKYHDMERGILPASLGPQCTVLRLMTGTRQGERTIRSVAKYISKPTYLLVDHLRCAGDFGQHVDGNPISLRFAASVCLAAIELCECIADDLSRGKAP